MKLSELLSKPFKVKGGGFLNLKGFSKRVIDEEIGGNDSGGSFNSFLSFEKITDTDKLDELNAFIFKNVPVVDISLIRDNDFTFNNNLNIRAFAYNYKDAFNIHVHKGFMTTFNENTNIYIIYKNCGVNSNKEWYIPQALYDMEHNIFYDIPGEKFNYYGVEVIANPLIPILYTEQVA